MDGRVKRVTESSFDNLIGIPPTAFDAVCGHKVSLKGIGAMLVLRLAYENAGSVSIRWLEGELVDGKHAIMTALQELERAGLASREQKRGKGGKMGATEWALEWGKFIESSASRKSGHGAPTVDRKSGHGEKSLDPKSPYGTMQVPAGEPLTHGTPHGGCEKGDETLARDLRFKDSIEFLLFLLSLSLNSKPASAGSEGMRMSDIRPELEDLPKFKVGGRTFTIKSKHLDALMGSATLCSVKGECWRAQQWMMKSKVRYLTVPELMDFLCRWMGRADAELSKMPQKKYDEKTVVPRREPVNTKGEVDYALS